MKLINLMYILNAATLTSATNFTRQHEMVQECVNKINTEENFEYSLTKNGVSFGCVGIPKTYIEAQYFVVDSLGRREIQEHETVKVYNNDGSEYLATWANVDFPSDCGKREEEDHKIYSRPKECEKGYEGTFPDCQPISQVPSYFASTCAYISPPPEWRVTTVCPVVLQTPSYQPAFNQYLPPNNNYLPTLPYLPPSPPLDDTCAHFQFPTTHSIGQVRPLLYIPFCAGNNPMAQIDIIRMERMFPRARPVPYLCNKCGFY